jgi:hypothetical protein
MEGTGKYSARKKGTLHRIDAAPRSNAIDEVKY